MVENVHSEVNKLLNDTTTTSSGDDFDALLDNFICKQIENAEDTLAEEEDASTPQLSKDDYISTESILPLAEEERRLFGAYQSFAGAVLACADVAGYEAPTFTFEASDIFPRFRPTKIQRLNDDIYTGWNILLNAQPVRLSSLPKNPNDEQILNFAEKTTDENLQAALISYVEILIEMDGCEIAYNIRKAKAKKRKIERKIIEEYNQRKEKMEKYISLIKKEKFPIDAERLVNNFFKTARKDPDGAQKIIENNPATFAPIEVEKIPNRLFGLIKAKPEDGIRVNKEIGNFFKTLKD